MVIPELNTFEGNENLIQLYWEASPTSDVKKWRIYGAKGITVDFNHPNKGVDLTGGSNSDNQFIKIGDDIPNMETPMTPKSCLATYTRDELGIGPKDPYYFLITAIDNLGHETPMSKDNIHAVPFRDPYFVDEAGEPLNVVYKNFEFVLPPCSPGDWDPERCLDINRLLGRPAKEIAMDATGSEFQIRLNSVKSDIITIRNSVPYNFDKIRGSMKIEKIFIHNATTTESTVRIYIAG